MADQRPGSYAHSIDPDGSIKGPDLTSAFDRVADPQRSVSTSQQTTSPAPVIASQQVANTNLSPRAPAPTYAYDRAKAVEHQDKMRADDKAVKAAYLSDRVKLFAQQNAAKKAKAQSISKSFDRSRDRDRDYER